MPTKADVKLKKREAGFDLSSVPHCKLKEYNALTDNNMRHYFENKKIQQLLYTTGQIDRHGRVIDLSKNKAKVNILEREFKEAERIEEQRLREELEMRYRVQRKRFNDLERTRREDILLKVKQDRELSKEIIATVKSATSYSPQSTGKGRSRGGDSRGYSPAMSGGSMLANSGAQAMTSSNSGFFVTNGQGGNSDEY